jgi:hypothetical protein
MIRKGILVVVTVVACAAVAQAAPVFYLSDQGSGAPAPGILSLTGVALGSTGMLHVWADTDIRLSGVSLDLLKTGGAIKFTSLDVPNPSNRWAFKDGTVTISDSEVTRIGGGAIPNLAGSGIGPSSGVSSPVLIGSVGYQAQANGTSQLFLRVGGNVISDWIGQAPDVHFGTPATAAVPGGAPGGIGPVGSIMVGVGEGFMSGDADVPTDTNTDILSTPTTTSHSSPEADGNGDGKIETADYVIWPKPSTINADNLKISLFHSPPKPPYIGRLKRGVTLAGGDALSLYGNGVAHAGPALSLAAVPEPSSLMLLVAFSAVLFLRRTNR